MRADIWVKTSNYELRPRVCFPDNTFWLCTVQQAFCCKCIAGFCSQQAHVLKYTHLGAPRTCTQVLWGCHLSITLHFIWWEKHQYAWVLPCKVKLFFVPGDMQLVSLCIRAHLQNGSRSSLITSLGGQIYFRLSQSAVAKMGAQRSSLSDRETPFLWSFIQHYQKCTPLLAELWASFSGVSWPLQDPHCLSSQEGVRTSVQKQHQ